MNRLNRRKLLQVSGMAAAALALRAKAYAWADAAPVVAIKAGKISGIVEDGINVFRSVPYGGDTAKTRFKAAVAPARWTGVRECSAFTTMAPQLMVWGQIRLSAQLMAPPGSVSPPPTSASGVPGAPRDVGVQSEDCLHLNVFTPGLRDGKKRPVLVYFHGGAYNNGTVNSDLYDGKRLCHRGDVVVVTVNHRLNAFGYMYLGYLSPEYKESGNVGQLDLVLALNWIRKNIAEFGGDSSRVLIFGQSGGGAKCAALMASPVARDLFHRVMTMSGQQIKGASIEIASARAQAVLDKLGVTGVNGKEAVAKLNSLTMEQIQEGARAVSGDWLPVVDNVHLFRDPFDPDAPLQSETVPMMLGNVHDETMVAGRGGEMTWATAPAALDEAIHQYLGPYTADEVVEKFRELHPDYTPQQVDIAAATAFRAWPGQRWEAERRAANPVSQQRTWVYQMNFQGAAGRAMHMIDIPFMFDNIAMASGQIGTDPQRVAEANALAAVMSGMLIQYGRTGNPNGAAGLPEWPTYDLTRRATMMWEAKPRVEDDPRGEERIFADRSHYHQAGTPMP
jgi:para-nitrobenzyl esterase